jgi:hypothetical protein
VFTKTHLKAHKTSEMNFFYSVVSGNVFYNIIIIDEEYVIYLSLEKNSARCENNYDNGSGM